MIFLVGSATYVNKQSVYIRKYKNERCYLAAAAFFIIFVGGFGVFLVEHGHPGANITQYSDAVWWAVVTLATVGYGDYYPVTALGRIIAIFMMISGVGIFALMVATFARRRLQKAESKLGRSLNLTLIY